jgi:hypothetical protein
MFMAGEYVVSAPLAENGLYLNAAARYGDAARLTLLSGEGGR